MELAAWTETDAECDYVSLGWPINHSDQRTVHVAVPDGNRTLFCYVFRLRYRI